MVTSAVDTRENIKFVISEYTEFGDKDLTYLPQLKALSPNIIIHRKWDEDWGVSNNPRIPKAPAWLNTNDGVKRGVSMSIPNEEAIPLWFPTVRFYQEGMLKYLKKGEETINGWPVNYRDWHTDNCDNTLNLTAVMKLSWDIFFSEKNRDLSQHEPPISAVKHYATFYMITEVLSMEWILKTTSILPKLL